MLEAEERLRAAGFTRAHLWVLEGNDRAASFYERHGWREDGAFQDDDQLIRGEHPQTLRERRRVRDLIEKVSAVRGIRRRSPRMPDTAALRRTQPAAATVPRHPLLRPSR